MALAGELVDPREAMPEWDPFVRERRLPRAWDREVLAALAASRRVWCGMVHDNGRVLAAFTGRLRGPGPRTLLGGCFEFRSAVPDGTAAGAERTSSRSDRRSQ